MDTGIVLAVNRRTSRALVRLAAGDCAAVLVLGDFRLQVGDEVEARLHTAGEQALLNLTTGEVLQVVNEAGAGDCQAAWLRIAE